LASGGRYDELLGKFDHPAEATGFGVFFDRLIEATGKTAEERESCCIVYTPKYRKDALKVAREKPEKGQCIAFQELAGISELASFTKQFSKVFYFTDSNHKGGVQ